MLVEEKDKKISEIMKKSKDDKLKMYNFIQEFETYKENAERDKHKSESTVKLYEADSTKSRDHIKPLMMDRCIQADDGPAESCRNCVSVQNQCDYLVEKLSETQDMATELMNDYEKLKMELE